MSQIITNTPLWVWPLFLLLLAMGLRAARDRWVPVALIYCLPLLGISGVRTVTGLEGPMMIWLGFMGGYFLGLWIGFQLQQRWVIVREGARVHVRGEYWTLSAMMLIFGANFVSGVLEAVAPSFHAHPVFQLIFAALIALGSGSFAGRGLRIWLS